MSRRKKDAADYYSMYISLNIFKYKHKLNQHFFDYLEF